MVKGYIVKLNETPLKVKFSRKRIKWSFELSSKFLGRRIDDTKEAFGKNISFLRSTLEHSVSIP